MAFGLLKVLIFPTLFTHDRSDIRIEGDFKDVGVAEFPLPGDSPVGTFFTTRSSCAKGVFLLAERVPSGRREGVGMIKELGENDGLPSIANFIYPIFFFFLQLL